RNSLAGRISNQFLWHRHCTAIATQQQPIAFKRREVFADSHFGRIKMTGKELNTNLTGAIKHIDYGPAALLSITFGHGERMPKFRNERHFTHSKDLCKIESREMTGARKRLSKT